MGLLYAHDQSDGVWTDSIVYAAMREYAKGVIDHILSRPDMIYVDDEDGTAEYSYDTFEKFKQELQ